MELEVSRIFSQHYQEWLNSAIAPSLIERNLKSLEGQQALDALLYSEELPRVNTGILSSSLLKRYSHVEKGGWVCRSLDPLNNWQEMEWSQLKPDSPRENHKGDLLKYESPPKVPQRAYFPDVPNEIWEAIAYRFDAELSCPVDVKNYCFWQWFLDHKEIPLHVAEGAKKGNALLSAGYAACALPGITMGIRTQKDERGKITARHLLPELVPLVKGRFVYIDFDQESKEKTRLNVRKATFTLGRLLGKNEALAVRVNEWERSLGKGCDDVISQQGKATWDSIVSKAQNFHKWAQWDYSMLSFEPSLRVNQRYLDLDLPSLQPLIAIKSMQGTGKTEMIARRCHEAIEIGQPVFLLTHRESLAKSLSPRLGVPYRTERCPQGKILGFSLCVDSLRPKPQGFNYIAWENSEPLVILDESEQVIWHLLNGSTEVKKYRVEILHQLRQLLTLSVNKAVHKWGQIILADAHLSDLSINFVKAMTREPGLTPWVIVNDWKPEGWDVTSYQEDKPEHWHSDLVRHIEAGGKPLIVSSSQKAKSPCGTVVLEAHIKSNVRDKSDGSKKGRKLRVLRLDAETLGDPNHPAYQAMANLDETLSAYDVVVASPSIETGVSINLEGHFDSVWGYSAGNLPAINLVQMLWRLRDEVPRYLWVRQSGFSFIGNGATSYKSLAQSQEKLTQSNIAQLRHAEIDSDTIDGPIDPICTRTWAKMGARQNQHFYRYRETIEELLSDQGHRVNPPDTNISSGEQETIKEEVKQSRDEAWEARCEMVAQALEIDEKRAKELEDSRSKTRNESDCLRKHQLQQRYHIPIETGLVKKDDEGWYKQLRFHYYLTVGRDDLRERDRALLNSMLEAGGGAAFKPDINRTLLGAKIAASEILGLPKLLDDPEREFRASDDDLIKIADYAFSQRQELKTILGITIHSPKTNKDGETKLPTIGIAKQLLDLLGLNLKRHRRERRGGTREWVYKLKNLDDERQAIFEQWQRRDRKLASQKEVGTAAQSNHSLTSSCASPEVPVPPLKKNSNSASQLPVLSPGDEESREVAQQHNKQC